MAAASLKSCVDSESNRDYLVAVKKLSEDIVDSKTNVLEVVEGLGDCLINKEAEKRGKGVRILGDVISNLPKNYLRNDEVKYFIIFFGERLKDILVISDALYGLKVLSGVDGLSFEEVDMTLSFIFQEVFTQSLVQKDREHVFTIFHNFLNSNLPDVKSMDTKFVTGFLQAMEGEKDPRNLMILFNLLPLVINNLNIDVVVEELFEVTACYFPIDYSPPPNDTRGVKRDDLVLGLRKCITSTPKFAEHFLPLSLEKLDSELKSAKLDTLATLIECCKIYKWENLKSFYADIWKSIRREVFTNTDPEITATALSALTAVFKTTSSSMTHMDSDEEYESLIKETLDECISYLGRPDANFFISTVSLVNALCVSTTHIADKIFKTIFPMLLNRYALSIDLNHRKISIDAISLFLKTHQQMYQNQGVGPVSLHKTTLWIIYSGIVESNDPWSLKCAAVEGLVTMAITHSFLNTNELQKLMEMLTKHAVDQCETSFGVTCLTALSKLSTESTVITSTILNHLLPQIMQFITQRSTVVKEESSLVERHLGIIAAISTCQSTFEASIPLLINELNNGEDGHSHSILHCINSIARRCSLEEHNMEFWQNSVLLPLVQFLQKISPDSTRLESHYGNVSLIYRSILPRLSENESRKLLLHILKAYSKSEEQLSRWTIEMTSNFVIVLLDSIFGCARKELFLKNNEVPISKFSVDLINFAFAIIDQTSSSELSLCASKCLASLINKYPTGTELDQMIEGILESINISLNNGSTSIDLKIRMIQPLTWMTKAMVMRGHPKAIKFIETLFSGLENEALSGFVAKEFHIIQRDYEDSFNISCHANVGLLYKQRFFLMTYQKLIDGFHNSSPEVSCNYLTALVCQLTLIPKDIFIAEAHTLMATLIKGLVTNDSQLLFSILSTLSALIQTDSSVIETYCDTLIDYLLPLTTFKGNMTIRIEALRCLAQFTTLPTDLILKHKQDVVQRLIGPLDDHKRLVRKEAAFARSCWCLVGC